MEGSKKHVDLEQLFKLRLVVARFGEMDNARWWNTKGMLGRLGGLALKRGFPKTYRFAQARAVFAVAAQRCQEIFNPPQSMTLWKLPSELEDQLDACWMDWLDQADQWIGFFQRLESVQGKDLLAATQDLGLVSREDIENAKQLRRTADGRAVQLPGTYQPNDEVLNQLALGFFRSEPGAPAIPYARLDV